MTPDATTLTLTPAQWQAWLSSLSEVGGAQLMRRSEVPAGTHARDINDVDEYVLSAYAEAMQSAEVDGELWQTYRDLELEGAEDDAAAWAEIVAFYTERGVWLVEVEGSEEAWLLAPELLARLRCPQLAEAQAGARGAVTDVPEV